MKVYILRIRNAQGEFILSSKDFRMIVREYHTALEDKVWPLLYLVDLEALTIQRIGWEKEEVK